MRIVAGLDTDFFGSRQIKEKLSIGYIFQNYEHSLFPWYDVTDNISYFFIIQKIPKNEREKLVKALLEKLEINIDVKCYPYQLSGGQKQLVAFLRSLIIHPDLLILDEAFTSLDEVIKFKLYNYIQEIHVNESTAILHISHDLDESILLSSKLFILNKLDIDSQGSLLDQLDINFTRPRNLGLLESNNFFKVRSEILSLMRKSVYEQEKND